MNRNDDVFIQNTIDCIEFLEKATKVQHDDFAQTLATIAAVHGINRFDLVSDDVPGFYPLIMRYFIHSN